MKIKDKINLAFNANKEDFMKDMKYYFLKKYTTEYEVLYHINNQVDIFYYD